MKEEYVNSFLAPTKLVWEKELGCGLELAGMDLVSNQFTTDDVTAVIGVSGRLEGNVLYGFSQETAYAVMTQMLGEPVDSLSNELGLSAIGEIANMITGNAATRLAQAGYPCNISPPVIIEPLGSRFTTFGSSQIRVIFKSPLGPLSVRLSLYETPTRD
jgi:chemotaxis protein CheX